MKGISVRPICWLREVCKWHAAYQTGTVRHLVYPSWEDSRCFKETWAKPLRFWSKALTYTVSWETRWVRRAQSIGCPLIILIWSGQRHMPGKVLDSAGSWVIWLALHRS